MKMKRTIQGFTMIEVLIAVLVVSFGMLGIASVLFASMRSSTSNYTRQVAAAYAYDIIDRMRANDVEAAQAGGPYTVAMDPTGPGTEPTSCVASTCTAAAMAAYDVWEWQYELENNLPSGEGSITIAAGSNNTYTVTVKVQWADTPGATAFSSTSNSTGTTGTINGTDLGTYTVVTAL
jgi:type IV pilus assembly protein PilV